MIRFKQALFILFLLFAAITASNAQYFSTTIDVDNSSDVGWEIHWAGEEFVILSGTLCITDESGYIDCPTILRVSPDGELLDYRTIKEHQVSTPNSLTYNDTDGTLTILLEPRPSSDSNIILQRYSTDLTFLAEQKHGGDIDYELAFFVTPYKEGYVVSNLILEPDEEPVMWIQYLDEDMQQTHEVFFPEFTGDYDLVAEDDLIATSDGHLVGTTNGGFLTSLTGLVTKLDSLGQVVWQTTFPADDSQINDWTDIQVAELGNGILAANWQDRMDPEVPEYSPSVLIINGLSGETGEIVWSYPFLRERWVESYVLNLMAAENGDLIGMGYIEDIPDPNPLPETDWSLLIGWIFRMSADGELKWQRYIYDDRSPLFFPSFLYNATELPNGDLAFVGVYQDTFPSQDPFINDPNVWLVRTDSNGCLTPNCGYLQIVTDTGIITSTWEEFLLSREQLPFQVFPNPATEAWNVEWPHNTNAQLVLYNMQGQAIRQEELQPGTNRVSALNLPPGMYVMQVRSREGWGSRKVVRR